MQISRSTSVAKAALNPSGSNISRCSQPHLQRRQLNKKTNHFISSFSVDIPEDCSSQRSRISKLRAGQFSYTGTTTENQDASSRRGSVNHGGGKDLNHVMGPPYNLPLVKLGSSQFRPQ